MAYVGACDRLLHARMLETIGKQDQAVLQVSITSADERLAHQLCYMLALVCEGPALSKAGQGEGCLTWKRIVEFHEPGMAGSQAAVLQQILSDSFGGGDIRPAIGMLELHMRSSEEQPGEELQDVIKMRPSRRAPQRRS